MIKAEEKLAASTKALPARVYFSVGALEEDQLPTRHMVSNLQAFSAQLKTHNYQGLDYETLILEKEDHLSVFPSTVSKGLRYLYAPPETRTVHEN